MVTLKELAKMLNVSIYTVSKTLSYSSEINDKTKFRIKSITEEYEYSPNIQAKYFNSRKTNTVGVIKPNLESIFFLLNLF
ncbi:LacI family DNA-binding transcriptional regulator [Aquimarina latercula]|uniref:LacI family DNA-binding transcriptional regulator n=1 Tax=Aquimarina latercula TaxID=987 RepID=UPI0003F75EA7|nr:LacI family DNA-binding transcriptional regulator [Aquimarina latercula]